MPILNQYLLNGIHVYQTISTHFTLYKATKILDRAKQKALWIYFGKKGAQHITRRQILDSFQIERLCR